MFLKAGFLELGFIEDPDIAFGWYIKSPLIYNTSPSTRWGILQDKRRNWVI